jgi:hypothetical protein
MEEFGSYFISVVSSVFLIDSSPHAATYGRQCDLVSVSLVAAFYCVWFVAFYLFFSLFLKKHDATEMGVRMSSWMNCFLVVPFSIVVLLSPAETTELSASVSSRFFGFHPYSHVLYTLAAGYFLFDLIHNLVEYSGVAFLIHGVLCFTLYFCGLRPFAHYWGLGYLLFELSTIFMNAIHVEDRILKIRKSSLLFKATGLCFALSFFGARIVFGNYMNFYFWQDIFSVLSSNPSLEKIILMGLYGVSNVALSALNLFWMYKIFEKVFSSGEKKKSKSKKS